VDASTPPRLDLAAFGRWLARLYHLQPIKWKWIACGRWVLVRLWLLVLLGLVAGGVVGFLTGTGAESVVLSSLDGGLFAALLANLISIGMQAGLALALAPVFVSFQFEVVRSTALVFRSAELDGQYHPPRLIA
jgi:hypothetical protein